MADFLGNSDDFNPPTSDNNQVDPAAEFLAREEGELAQLGVENFNQTVASNGIDNSANQSFSSGPNLLNGSAAQTSDEAWIDEGAPESVDLYASVAEADIKATEPESIRRWRDDYARRIAEKDEAAQKEQEEWKNTAKDEIEQWYSRQQDQNDKIKRSNREAEEAFVGERDSIIPGHEWERVASLCDFTSKSYKCTKDTTRMRSIILQLKQTPLKRDIKVPTNNVET